MLETWKERRKVLIRFQQEFFQSLGLKTDILEYSYMPEAYVYVVGILNSIQMTDFYPQKLKNELYIIAKNYNGFLKQQAEKKKHMLWAYETFSGPEIVGRPVKDNF